MVAKVAKIMGLDADKGHKWLRPALVAIPVIAILATLFIWQPWNSSYGSQGVIAEAQAATADLQSYRVSIEGTGDTESEAYKIEAEFSAPDRYHNIYSGNGFDMEVILISEVPYFRELLEASVGVSTWSRMAQGYSSLVSREYTTRTLDYLTGVQELPDEVIDGVNCVHIGGTYDWEKQMREFLGGDSQRGRPPISEARLQEMIEEREEAGITTINLWIGKEDYLIRKMERVTQIPDKNGVIQSGTQILRFYDLNEPIAIEAPVDSQGNLLPGWITTHPESPNIGTEMQADIDNYDPSNRNVTFNITLTNIGEDTLTDVDVRIQSVFPDREDNPNAEIWQSSESGQLTRGPYTLDASKSLEYGATFGYDATSIDPDIISETIENSYIEVSYFIPNGQLKVEIFHFDAPESLYTLSTVVPPHLVPIEIRPSGEYRIKEMGATYTGNGVTGEIKGKEYLFVEINTAGAEEPASPGILVLDITNKTSPRKVAYLNTGDDTRYIGGASLYESILYVSADDYLWVIDVTNPSSPKELSRLPGLDTNQMMFSGKYALINDGNHDIVTLDLSDPANPQRIGNLPLSSATSIQMDVYGDYLLAEANDVLYTIDASSPPSLEIVGETSFRAPLDDETPDIIYPYHIMGTEIEGDYAYVTLSTEGNLAIGILDLSEPASPVEIAFHRLKGSFHGSLFISGERAFVFTMNNWPSDLRKRLDILDISDPAKPEETGFGYMPDSWSFFPDTYGGSHQTFGLIDNYLYWFIGDSPNKPVIEVLDLRELNN